MEAGIFDLSVPGSNTWASSLNKSGAPPLSPGPQFQAMASRQQEPENKEPTPCSSHPRKDGGEWADPILLPTYICLVYLPSPRRQAQGTEVSMSQSSVRLRHTEGHWLKVARGLVGVDHTWLWALTPTVISEHQPALDCTFREFKDGQLVSAAPL